MESCLGILTENNLIKYAKVSKERESVTVDAYGVKFFDNLEEAIEQIVDETQSKNTPININLTDEIYNRFEVFNGLKQKDIESILASEFELLCDDKSLNFQSLTSTYILAPSLMDKEKATALYVSANRGDIAGKLQRLEEYRIKNLVPVPIALYNMLYDLRENIALVNIEEKTSVTVIVSGNIVNVKILDIGMKQILDQISAKENSYAKAYQACKNTTIYTVDAGDAPTTGSEYLQDIMPVLYEIVNGVKQVLDEDLLSVQKVVLTGTATVINNLELYFQEYFPASKCELLNPGIASRTGGEIVANFNNKELAEVNSAIALAKTGIGEGIQETNFKNIYTKGNVFAELKKMVTKDVALGQNNGEKRPKTKKPKSKKRKKLNVNIDLNLKGDLDKVEKMMVRSIVTIIMVVIFFSIASVIISKEIKSKITEADKLIAETNSVITTINNDISKTNSKKSQYIDRAKKLDELTGQVRADNQYRKAIPNLLNQIMAVIPVQVQITSIENTSDNKIVIAAQSSKYEELGYFGAVLKNQGILLGLTVTAGSREGELIKISIEGTLP